MSNVTIMMKQYLETALWSSNDWDDQDECGNPTQFDEKFGIGDFTDEAVQSAIDDCVRFLELLGETDCPDFENLLEAAYGYGDDEDLGHDFWLTRGGHGAGFWDGDYGDYGDAITKVVHDNFSEVTPMVESNGKVGWL